MTEECKDFYKGALPASFVADYRNEPTVQGKFEIKPNFLKI